MNKKDVISGPEEDGIQELRNRIKGIRERLDETKQRFGVEPELEKDSECDIQFLRDRMQSVQDRIDDTKETIGAHYESMEDTMEDIKENQDDDLEIKRQDAWKENLEDQKEEKESRSLKEIFADMKESLGNIKNSVKESSGGIFDMLIILGQIAFLVWYYWKDLAPLLSNLGKQIGLSIKESLSWLPGIGVDPTDYVDSKGNVIDSEKLQAAVSRGDIEQKDADAAIKYGKMNAQIDKTYSDEDSELKDKLEAVTRKAQHRGGIDKALSGGFEGYALKQADPEKYEEFKKLREELQSADKAFEKVYFPDTTGDVDTSAKKKEDIIPSQSSASESDLLERLVDGIQKQEGWYPGSRSYRNNNPGNLEYGDFAKRHGAIGSDGRFAIFPDYETGRAATAALAKSSGYKGMSIAEMGARWSPGQKGAFRGILDIAT